MGSFGGHALPGTFFFLWGLWTGVQCIRLLHKRRLHGKDYYGHAAFVVSFCGHRLLPWEGILKIFLPIAGMSVEGIGFFWQNMAMIQHFSMYAFFLLAGVVDVMVFAKAPVPRNLDYAAHALAFTVEGLLFQFHTHGRTPLDILLHTLLVYGCYGCAAAMLLEMRYRKSVLAPLTRAFLVMFQGTWFWQVGYILYNPIGESWNEDDHDNIMLATVMAGWHMILIFVLLIVINSVVNRCYPRTEGSNTTALLPTTTSSSNATGGSNGGHLEHKYGVARGGELNGLLRGDSDDDSQL